MDWLKDNGIFMPMINDTGRNQFYKQAIDQCVAGKTVVDIGTGTGLLSILAARAGAKKVWAVEQDPVRAELARELIDKVGLNSVIEVVNKNFFDTDIPADIYVSETINTQIFGEDILQIAEHARKHGGQFIPSEFDLNVALYKDHPIFVLCQTRSDAFEFQPNIDIDSTFEQSVNQQFQQSHPLDNTLYRANILNGLFTMLPRFNDLKLEKLYESPALTLDLNQPIDINSITLSIPYTEFENYNDVYVVLFWKARFKNTVMKVNDTWFGNVSKTILKRCRKSNTDIVLTYNPLIRDWQVRF
jgi:SAM-dependent methyltransferase